MDDANLLALDPRLETPPRRVVQKIAIIALPIPASATARAARRLPRCGWLLNEVVVSGRLWAACRWRLLFGVLTQAVVGRWRPWCDMIF